MKKDLKYITLRSKNAKELINLVRLEFKLAKNGRKRARLFGDCFLDNEGYFSQVVVTFKKD